MIKRNQPKNVSNNRRSGLVNLYGLACVGKGKKVVGFLIRDYEASYELGLVLAVATRGGLHVIGS